MHTLRNIFLGLLFVFTIPFQSCKSPWFQETIDDPSTVQFKGTITRNVEAGRNEAGTIVGEVCDSIGNRMSLKKGGVLANGVAMQHRGGYYIIDSPSLLGIRPDSEYTFSVVLDNGKTYNSSIRTQKLSGWAAPDSITHGEPIHITWTGIDTTSSLFLQIYSSTDSTEINLQSFRNGSYTVTPQQYKVTAGGRSLRLQLVGAKFAGADSHLRPDSYLSSEFLFSKSVYVR